MSGLQHLALKTFSILLIVYLMLMSLRRVRFQSCFSTASSPGLSVLILTAFHISPFTGCCWTGIQYLAPSREAV